MTRYKGCSLELISHHLLSRVYIWMRTECGMQKWSDRLMQMCYWGEANSIWLCDECSANSWTLSVDCWYFKGNSHSIHLCRVYSMPNTVQMYHTFFLASLPHASFAFVFRFKPGFIVFTLATNSAECIKNITPCIVKYYIPPKARYCASNKWRDSRSCDFAIDGS